MQHQSCGVILHSQTMKNQLLLPVLLLSITACTNNRPGTAPAVTSDQPDTTAHTGTVAVQFHDTVLTVDLDALAKKNDRDWQVNFGLTYDVHRDSIANRPVYYYISDKQCAQLAIDFYYGRLRPSDNTTTDSLLQLATTGNDKLRPCYRCCLSKSISVQDGALAEHTGTPARRYAEKFPEEFFEYTDVVTTGETYTNWVAAIEYSGFYEADDYQQPGAVRRRMSHTMKAACTDCNNAIIKRIEKFAKDCYP